MCYFFFQAEDGIRDYKVTGVQTCALPIYVPLGVRDIERSAKWYIEVLGFERLHEDMWNGVPTFIGKGTTGIALFAASPNAKSGPSTSRDVQMLHLAFRADRENFLAAQRELEKR